MMVTFPIGAFGLSLASDALHGVSGERKYAEAATLALDFGLATGALAMPFGLIDWWAIPAGTRAKRVGLLHAASNAVMLGMFAASRWLRKQDEQDPAAKYVAGAAFLLSGFGAWLGGELVDRYGIGLKRELVDDESASLPMSEEAPTLRGLFPRAKAQPTTYS